jgi:hypothetical protein
MPTCMILILNVFWCGSSGIHWGRDAWMLSKERRIRKCNTQCVHKVNVGGTVQQTGRHNNKQNRRHLQKRSTNPHSLVFPHKETQSEKQVVKSLGCVGGLKTEAARENNASEGRAVYLALSLTQSYTKEHAGGFRTKVEWNWSNQ